jgi:outer membrane protein TolC
MRKTILFLSILIFCYPYSFAQFLNVDDYLKIVEQKNPQVKSIDSSIIALEQKMTELDMAYSPYLSANYNYNFDKSSPDPGSTLMTNSMATNVFNVGINKIFNTGTKISAGYTSVRYDISLLTPLNFYGNDLWSVSGYDLKPIISFEQSLLRNFGSGQTQSGIEKTKSSIRYAKYMQMFKRQQVLLNARAKYWSLSFARDVIDFRKISLERTKKLEDWQKRKVDLNLVDETDLMQTEAACKLRDMNLTTAYDEEEKLARQINVLIGELSKNFDYNLEKISDKVDFYSNIKSLEKESDRLDVLAYKENYKSFEFAEKEKKYQMRPELSLIGNYAVSGRAFNFPDAASDMASLGRPVYNIGLALIFPLDLKKIKNVNQRFKNDSNSAKELLNDAKLSSNADWEDILLTWTNLQRRIEIAKDIKNIQEKRLIKEQKKFEMGRLTTFQLLTTENDVDDATLNLYNLILQEIITFDRTRLYK